MISCQIAGTFSGSRIIGKNFILISQHHYQWHQITKTSCCNSFQLSWPKNYNSAKDNTSGITWCQGWYQWCYMPQKCHLVLKNAMVLSTLDDTETKAVVPHDTNTNTHAIMWCHCWCQWHHMTKIVMLNLISIVFKIRNAMVPLMMLLALCDVDASANGINYQSHVMLHLISISWPKECNGTIFDGICIMWCKYQCQCCISFWLSWLMKCRSANDDTTGIRWCWFWCHWHHMTKKSCYISFWSPWPNKWNGAIDETVGIT